MKFLYVLPLLATATVACPALERLKEINPGDPSIEMNDPHSDNPFKLRFDSRGRRLQEDESAPQNDPNSDNPFKLRFDDPQSEADAHNDTIAAAATGSRRLQEDESAPQNDPYSDNPFKLRFDDPTSEANAHNETIATAASRKLYGASGPTKKAAPPGSKSTKTYSSYQAITTPYCLMTSGAAATSSAANTCAAYKIVKAAFDNYVTACAGNVYYLSTFYGALVRLAFHDAGEVDITSTDTYGPDGSLSFDGANAGLVEWTSIVYYGLEPVWQTICDKISRADYWVMLAKLALEASEPTNTLTIDYQYGRKDQPWNSNGIPDLGRLPSAEGDVDEMYRVFVTQMGLTLNDAATLLGAHSLGHVHYWNSGYGYTTVDDGYDNGFDDTPHIFDNNFFYNMMTSPWVAVGSPFSPSTLTEFHSNTFTHCVNLPSDISVGYIRTSYSSVTTQTCGPYAVPTYSYSNGQWVTSYGYGCTPSSTIMPLTCWQSCNHGNSNSYFLQQFRISFSKMTCAGYGVPACSTGASASGKLGTLYYLDLTTCPA